MGNTLPIVNIVANKTAVDFDEIKDQNNSSELNDTVVHILLHDKNFYSSGHGVAIPILYTIIYILSFLGNLVTCIVITKNSTLQNATNCYLFSLSVSDVLLVISGSFIDIFVGQKFGINWREETCAISYFLYRASYNTSVLTVLAFSIERYLAICHPFSFKELSGLKRSIGIILAIWIICIVSAYPEFFRIFIRINLLILTKSGTYIKKNRKLGMCGRIVHPNYFNKYHDTITVTFFLIPMTMLFFVYIRIAIKIQNSLQNLNVAQQLQSYNRSRSIKMLFAVVVLNFICWTPVQTFYAIRRYSIYSPGRNDFADYMWYFEISKAFFLCSTFINPIIYNIMSCKFREAFFKTFSCVCGKAKENKENVQVSIAAYSE